MSEWKNIQISKNNVEHDTGRAVLINMPHKSNYDGFSFWHPSKCVRSGNNSNSLSIGYTNEFVFRLKKYGKNRNVIDEAELTAEEMEEELSVFESCTQKRSYNHKITVEEPEYRKPEQNEVDESLLC